MPITHPFVSGIPDEADSTLVRPSNWNDDHTIDLSDMVVTGAVPTGTPNGVLTTFVLPSTPNPASTLKVYVNGVRQKLTTDYTLATATITFVVAPDTDDVILCDYWRLP